MGQSAVSMSGKDEPWWYISQPFHRRVKRWVRTVSLVVVLLVESLRGGVGRLLVGGSRVVAQWVLWVAWRDDLGPSCLEELSCGWCTSAVMVDCRSSDSRSGGVGVFGGGRFPGFRRGCGCRWRLGRVVLGAGVLEGSWGRGPSSSSSSWSSANGAYLFPPVMAEKDKPGRTTVTKTKTPLES